MGAARSIERMRGRTALAVAGGAAIGAGAAWLVLTKTKLAGFGLAALPDLKNALGVHVRQIRRYAFAASQDKSPIVGLTHASYSLVLLDTLEEIVGKDAIKAAGYDPSKLREFITKQQDRHAEMLQACDPHLQAVLALERGEPGGQIPGFVLAGDDVLAAPRGA